MLCWPGDSGTGIAEGHLPDLFDLVEGIVEAHVGEVRAASDAQGTCVYFTVPRAP